MGSRGFWQELKRRHVYRVAVAYAVVGWLLIQVTTQVFPIFHFPDWVDQAVVLLILVGFPIALVLAWAFDATPHGIVATDAAADGGAASVPLRRRSRRTGVAVGLMGVLIAAIAGGAWWQLRTPRGHPSPASFASRSPDEAQRNPGDTAPDSAAKAASSGLRSDVAALPTPAKSIAVLPFENLSEDKGNAYFADGMQDLILTKLADIGDLKVISRTSTMKYASHPDDLKTIGQQLGVATVLEGSVQKAGKQVLINVQLIDAKTDSHLWAQSYQRTLDNIFGVEGEVADKIAQALNAKLTAAESTTVASVPTQNPTAFDAYLRGEHLFSQLGVVDPTTFLPKALAAYQQAVAADPKFALAWARLALGQGLLAYLGLDTSDAVREEALANARRALALQPDLPEGHYALGYIYRFFFADYDKALTEFKLAEQGAPNSAPVVAAIAYVEDAQGDTQAAMVALQRASTLDPRNANIAANLAVALANTPQWNAARDALRRVEALAPEDSDAYVMPAELEVRQNGDSATALAQLAKVPPALQSDPAVIDARVRLLLYEKRYTDALEAAAGLPPNAGLLRADVNALAGHAGKAHNLYAQVLSKSHAPATALTPIWLERGLSGDLFDRAEAEAGLGNKTAAYDALQGYIAYARHVGNIGAATDAEYILARVHARFGDAKDATDILRRLLDADGTAWTVTAPLLKLDPVWDPIRNDPRFQALLKKYAQAGPAAGTSGSGHD